MITMINLRSVIPLYARDDIGNDGYHSMHTTRQHAAGDP